MMLVKIKHNILDYNYKILLGILSNGDQSYDQYYNKKI